VISYVGKEAKDWKRGSPEKRERNDKIVQQHFSGKSYREIAKKFRVHHSRVAQIVRRYYVNRWDF
jgi:Mor family transcriptional regulator